jgi:hypothetical protein
LSGPNSGVFELCGSRKIVSKARPVAVSHKRKLLWRITKSPPGLRQLILAQGILILLLILIAMKRTRYAVYLAAASGVMALVAITTGVTDAGLLVGETLPFYAVIFTLIWNGALPMQPAGRPVTAI